MFEEAALTDLFALSRDVERAARGSLANVRHVSSQKTYKALAARVPPLHDVLLRDALLRWIHELLQARIAEGLTDHENEALAQASEDPREPRTFEAARHGLLDERKDAIAAWDRLVERSPGVAAVRVEKKARRFEAARRLGLAHPWSLSGVDETKLVAAARALLDATEPLARDLRKRVRKELEGLALHPVDTIRAGLALDAREGWPAVLGERWMREKFPAFSWPARLERVPAPRGGATFLRAASNWGFALREGGIARSLPFALARDPYETSAHFFGDLLAIAVATPVFQRRGLDLAAGAAETQARRLMRALFAAARFGAMRLVFAAGERVSEDDHAELGERVFGVPLPSALRDAWPEAHIDEAARFASLLRAPGFVGELVSRHDEDWFENPRAGAELAQIASGPIFDATPPEDGAEQTIARAFEEALA